jgi:transcriptional regulator with XRE-family HTH domain
MKDSSKTDVQTVCKRTDGWNEAFKRLREQAGLSQEQLAVQIGCDRSAISYWESARFYPEPEMLKKALSALNVDARILFRHFGQKATELLKAQLNPEELALELGRELLEEANGKSQHDVASRIVELMDNRVLAAVSMRALHDAQSARLYFERSDRIREESRALHARLETARNITPVQFLPKDRTEDSNG